MLSADEAEGLLMGPLGTLVVCRVRQGGAGGDSANVPLIRQDVDVDDSAASAVGIAAALRVVREGVLVDKVSMRACARANACVLPCAAAPQDAFIHAHCICACR